MTIQTLYTAATGMNAQQLVAGIKGAMGKAGNKETRAHLSESLDLLSEALKAQMSRTI